MKYSVLVVLILMSFSDAVAQEFGRAGNIQVSGLAYKSFVHPGEATIQVIIMSNSAGSGVYEIGTSVTLERLLALAAVSGGTQTDRYRGKVTIRLHRSQGGNRSIIYESDLGQFLRAPADHPKLIENDVIEIEQRIRTRFGWRDGLSIVTAAASLTLAIERIRRVWF